MPLKTYYQWTKPMSYKPVQSNLNDTLLCGMQVYKTVSMTENGYACLQITSSLLILRALVLLSVALSM